MVFGKSIIESQQFFLGEIQEHARVLILGGGSGWLLSELLRIKPNCEVWYIDASEKMIALSRQKNPEHRVHFIHGTELDIPVAIRFDAVITNFYLDLFTNDQLKKAVERIQSSLNAGALWIVTDFVDGKWWQRMMLGVMYWFFRILCQIESQRLPEWSELMENAGIKEMESKFFYGDFIKTARFQG
jgi:ubiquinone/menaquinone biosynthesis C-methylase UbiE